MSLENIEAATAERYLNHMPSTNEGQGDLERSIIVVKAAYDDIFGPDVNFENFQEEMGTFANSINNFKIILDRLDELGVPVDAINNLDIKEIYSNHLLMKADNSVHSEEVLSQVVHAQVQGILNNEIQMRVKNSSSPESFAYYTRIGENISNTLESYNSENNIDVNSALSELNSKQLAAVGLNEETFRRLSPEQKAIVGEAIQKLSILGLSSQLNEESISDVQESINKISDSEVKGKLLAKLAEIKAEKAKDAKSKVITTDFPRPSDAVKKAA